MGAWNVDAKSEPGVLRLKLQGMLETADMKAFVEAHNRAIDAYGGADYKVWCDISEMLPLAPEGTELFQAAKRYSGDHANFRGSAVLVASATTAMQHRRTSVAGGVISSELISDDPVALKAHLRTVNRRAT